MNKRDHALQLQVLESVISDSPGGFGRETAVPEIRIQTVANFDFFGTVNFLMEKSAVADKGTSFALDHSKLRG